MPSDDEKEKLLPGPDVDSIGGVPHWTSRRRLANVLFGGVTLLIVVSLIVGTTRTIGDVLRRRRWHSPPRRIGSPRFPLEPLSSPEPLPVDGYPVACYAALGTQEVQEVHPFQSNQTNFDTVNHTRRTDTSAPSHAVVTTFQLPNGSSLYFLSRIGWSRGSIHFSMAEDDANATQVEIITSYPPTAERGTISICTLRKEDGSSGVGLYASGHDNNLLHFEMEVIFPRIIAAYTPPISVETMLPQLAHYFDDFSATPLGSLDVFTRYAPIKAKYLNTHRVAFETDYEMISGEFRVRQSIRLVTSNAPIEVAIHADNNDWRVPADVELRTTSAALEGVVMLNSTAQFERGHTASGMHIQASTANARLELSIPSAPVGSRLDVDAGTFNAKAHTVLPSTFEGRLTAITKNAPWRILNNPSTPDPLNQGRVRWMEGQEIVVGSWSGLISWGAAEHNPANSQGSVIIGTTNAENLVELL